MMMIKIYISKLLSLFSSFVMEKRRIANTRVALEREGGILQTRICCNLIRFSSLLQGVNLQHRTINATPVHIVTVTKAEEERTVHEGQSLRACVRACVSAYTTILRQIVGITV